MGRLVQGLSHLITQSQSGAFTEITSSVLRLEGGWGVAGAWMAWEAICLQEALFHSFDGGLLCVGAVGAVQLLDKGLWSG
jgi:hypothetical protein